MVKCHWPGCEKLVVPSKWCCTMHWYKLPQDIRHKIWHAKAASVEYRIAVQEAQAWIKRAYG